MYLHHTAAAWSYTLSLHDALPICAKRPAAPPCAARTGTWRPPWRRPRRSASAAPAKKATPPRSEEHTSELQSRVDLVCRLLLEKKKWTVCKLTKAACRPTTSKHML